MGIEALPDESEHHGGASYAYHARELRDALTRKDTSTVLKELIIILAKLESEST